MIRRPTIVCIRSVPDANQCPHTRFRPVAAEMRQFAARDLRPHECLGGSIALSSLGRLGIKEFAAAVNPPHAATLAVGRAEARVREARIEAATVMTVTLSADDRAVDGATGAIPRRIQGAGRAATAAGRLRRGRAFCKVWLDALCQDRKLTLHIASEVPPCNAAKSSSRARIPLTKSAPISIFPTRAPGPGLWS
ncbi:MAG: 2-oxo acid dehydrogenase subunit E2 [Bradyrhizobiaceae bacterium]|nr:2-oxo acid dehydrogenase subunit E2 [Bradyrhizobiaceae bacterium]